MNRFFRTLLAATLSLNVAFAENPSAFADQAEVEQSRIIRCAPLHQPWAFLPLASQPQNPGGLRTEMIRHGANWLETAVDELYAEGFRVILLHRLFGEPDGGDLMDYDARLQLRDAPITGPLVTQIPAVCERLLEKHPDLHLVAYVGSLNADTMSGVLVQKPEQWLARAALSIWPILESKSSRLHLCIDHSSGFAFGSPEHRWLQQADSLLARRGATLWIEAFPRSDHMAAFPAFGTELAWENGVAKGTALVSRISNTRFYRTERQPVDQWLTEVIDGGIIPAFPPKAAETYPNAVRRAQTVLDRNPPAGD